MQMLVQVFSAEPSQAGKKAPEISTSVDGVLPFEAVHAWSASSEGDLTVAGAVLQYGQRFPDTDEDPAIEHSGAESILDDLLVKNEKCGPAPVSKLEPQFGNISPHCPSRQRDSGQSEGIAGVAYGHLTVPKEAMARPNMPQSGTDDDAKIVAEVPSQEMMKIEPGPGMHEGIARVPATNRFNPQHVNLGVNLKTVGEVPAYPAVQFIEMDGTTADPITKATSPPVSVGKAVLLSNVNGTGDSSMRKPIPAPAGYPLSSERIGNVGEVSVVMRNQATPWTENAGLSLMQTDPSPGRSHEQLQESVANSAVVSAHSNTSADNPLPEPSRIARDVQALGRPEAAATSSLGHGAVSAMTSAGAVRMDGAKLAGHGERLLDTADPLAGGASTAVEGDLKTKPVDRARPEPVAARSILNQVIQSVSRSQGDGVVEIRLQPEELGRIRLTMVAGEAGMTVQILAERGDTLDLVRRNIDMLERDLSESGFENLSFSFGGERQDPDREDGNDRKEEAPTNGSDAAVGLTVAFADAPGSSALGKLDIRV